MTRITAWRFGAVLLAAAGLAAGQVPLPDYIGTGLGDARSLGLGRTALEPGPAALFGNPALLGLAPGSAVQVGFGLKLAAETRTRVVYDQFDNSLGEVAIAENAHTFGIPGPLCGVYRLGRVGVGLGIAPVRDFNYSYTREYRDDFYVLTGEDRVVQTGLQYDAGAGAAVQLTPEFAVGAHCGYGFGTRYLESREFRGTDTTIYRDSGRTSALRYAAGLAYLPVRHLTVAFRFAGGQGPDEWSEADSSAGAYPWQAGLGLRYRAAGTLPSTFSLEAAYVPWRLVDSTDSDLLTVRAGVEHTMLNFVRLRYGFGLEPQPFDLSVQEVEAGFGLGFDVGVATIDVGALFGREVLGPQHFRAQLGSADSDVRVSATRSRIALSVARSF